MSNPVAPQREVLRLSDINMKFSEGTAETLHILRGINLSLRKSERVAILGQSGSGKSTLLQIMALLEKQNRGQIRGVEL
jgi:lipoprotein-releasing system ATP-binding protein